MIEAEQILTVAVRDGTEFEIKRLGSGPRVLFSHGAGFAVDAYAPFVHALAAHAEVFAFDLRGHGRGPQVSIDDYHLTTHIGDIADIAASIQPDSGNAKLNGVLHSISGVFAMRAQCEATNLFKCLVLFEPPLGQIGAKAQAFIEDKSKLASRAAKRRDVFHHVSELADRFRALITNEEHAMILANALLLEGDDGSFRLRCRPEIESRTYATNQSFGLWDKLPDIGCKGQIMSGKPAGTTGYPGSIAAEIAAAAKFEHLQLDGLGHLGFLEAPSLTASHAIAFIDKHN